MTLLYQKNPEKPLSTKPSATTVEQRKTLTLIGQALSLIKETQGRVIPAVIAMVQNHKDYQPGLFWTTPDADEGLTLIGLIDRILTENGRDYCREVIQWGLNDLTGNDAALYQFLNPTDARNKPLILMWHACGFFANSKTKTYGCGFLEKQANVDLLSTLIGKDSKIEDLVIHCGGIDWFWANFAGANVELRNHASNAGYPQSELQEMLTFEQWEALLQRLQDKGVTASRYNKLMLLGGDNLRMAALGFGFSWADPVELSEGIGSAVASWTLYSEKHLSSKNDKTSKALKNIEKIMPSAALTIDASNDAFRELMNSEKRKKSGYIVEVDRLKHLRDAKGMNVLDYCLGWRPDMLEACLDKLDLEDIKPLITEKDKAGLCFFNRLLMHCNSISDITTIDVYLKFLETRHLTPTGYAHGHVAAERDHFYWVDQKKIPEVISAFNGGPRKNSDGGHRNRSNE